MIDNPYQPPSVDAVGSAAPVHRSFRLTPRATPQGADASVGSLRQAIVFSLVQQLPLWLLSAMLLDGGFVLRRVAIATVAFWGLTVIVLMRRGRHLPDSDILLIKWAYLPILCATCIWWLIALSIRFWA